MSKGIAGNIEIGVVNGRKFYRGTHGLCAYMRLGVGYPFLLLISIVESSVALFHREQTVSESQSESVLWLCNCANAAAALAAGSIEVGWYSSTFRGVLGVLESSR